MSEIRKIKKGEVIFREGDWEMTMFEVKSGKVGIYANYGKDGEKLLTELEKGKIFGEMGLVEARPRSATAVALDDTELGVIDSEGLSEFFTSEPEKVVGLLVNMTKRIRELSSDYIDVCDSISSYLEASGAKKESIWTKIKNAMTFDGDYKELYSEMIQSGNDPFRSFNVSINGYYW